MLNVSDDRIASIVRFHTRQLARRLDLNLSDTEDVRQDLFLELTRAFRRYDPSLSSPATFASRVLDKATLNIARNTRSRRGFVLRNLDISQLDQLFCEISGLRQNNAEHHLDLNADVRHVMYLLPDGLVQLACELMVRSPSQIARRLGIHRGTVCRRIHHLRPYFAGLTSNHCLPENANAK
jgi:RNA polymerase sigma factor (sigma-70 family)